MIRDEQGVQTTLHILLVEDNPDHASIIQRALQTAKIPIQIKVVNNGFDALEYVRNLGQFSEMPARSKPDVILLDLKLPRCDGVQVAQSLKSDPQLRAIPIVTLTTSARPEDRALLLACGVDDYITKPNNYDEFKGIAAIIQSVLDKHC